MDISLCTAVRYDKSLWYLVFTIVMLIVVLGVVVVLVCGVRFSEFRNYLNSRNTKSSCGYREGGITHRYRLLLTFSF